MQALTVQSSRPAFGGRLTFGVRPQKDSVTHYCTLVLRSDDPGAAAKLLIPEVVDDLDFDDNQSPARLASAQRLRAAGMPMRSDLPRYVWLMDSRQAIPDSEIDLLVHVSWLLSRVKAGVSLREARERGVEAALGFYWGGNGTGGGPFISPELAELLTRHNIGLNVGFYYEEYEIGAAAA